MKIDRYQSEYHQTIIVGAGPAGIATSYYLDQFRVSHILLERMRPFASWHRRWEGFCMNTANWMNGHPSICNHTLLKRKERASLDEILEYFDFCYEQQQPPVHSPVNVCKIEKTPRDQWKLSTERGGYLCDNVIIATGSACLPRLPELHSRLPAFVPQFHTRDYQNPDQLRTRNVLVVGSGSSGVQITEKLLRSGRFDKVYLSCSNNISFPWRVLGLSIHRLIHSLGLFDLPVDSWLGKKIVQRARGHGDPATPPTPKWLARNLGAVLLPRVTHIGDGALWCHDQCLGMADLSVIWCTGFQPDFSIFGGGLDSALLGIDGQPRHKKGVVPGLPGLYFMGLRFQSTLSSHILYGMARDAEFVARHIARRKTGRNHGN